MNSSDNNNKSDSSSGNVGHQQSVKKSVVPHKTEHHVPEHLDLDKNPIQYATSEPGKFTTEAHDKPYMELTLRHGKHTEVAQKLLRQRIEARAKEFPRWPADRHSGVRYMWCESRFWYDRERLGPDFDNDWRAYRARYLHSLELDPREPVHVPEYERELINPIRRFYMKTGDWFENNIIKRIFKKHHHETQAIRLGLFYCFGGYLGCVAFYYWIRYHHHNWQEHYGMMLRVSRPFIYPGHPNYPFKDYRTEHAHHFDQGFSRRQIYKDLRDYEDISTIQ